MSPAPRHLRTMALAAFLTLVGTGSAQAQVSDAQIIEDLTSAGVKKVVLSKSRGSKHWSADRKVHEYTRNAEVIRPSELKGVDLVVSGTAVYDFVGSKPTYARFRVIENYYLGLPDPKPEELVAIVKADVRQFIGAGRFGDVVGNIRNVRLADEPRFKWLKPTLLVARLVAELDHKVSITEIATTEQHFEVRFYRDAVDAPFSAKFQSVARESTELARKKYAQHEIAEMKTLAELASEDRAQAAAKALPQVDVPAFDNPVALVLFTHKMLREATPEQFEAFLMKALAPDFFIAGSTVQLNERGATLINQSVERAFKKKATYRAMYCADPGVDKKRTTASRFYLLGAVNDTNTVIGVTLTGGGYVDGQKVGQSYKLSELQVGVRQDEDAIQFVSSFSDRKKLCPRDP